MSLRTSYNEAGLPEQLELDRGTGSGWEDVVTSVTDNARGQVTELEHGNGVVTTRDPERSGGRRKSRAAGSVGYDADIERLTRIFTELPGSPDVEFQDLEYEYDPVGNPLSITDNLTSSSYAANDIIPNTRTFRYDARYRLTRATGKMHDTITDRSTGITVTSPDPNDYVSYDFMVAYDEVGNFTRNDEYQSTGTTTLNYKSTRIDLYNGNSTEATNSDPTLGNFTYDANGNTLHTPRIDELAYTFDNQVRYVDLGGGGEVRYFRHGDQRVVRMVQKTGVTGLSIYLGPFEYHYRDATTGYTKLTLHCGLHGRHAQAEVVLDGSDPDSLDLFFVHGDHLGSGHVLTKDDGTLLSQEEYFPYGRASDRRDSRNRYRYIGVERDEDTGLCMTGPRTYDPVSGRFLQGDPLQSSEAPYSYVSANPIVYSDSGGYAKSPRDNRVVSVPEDPTMRQDKIEQILSSSRVFGSYVQEAYSRREDQGLERGVVFAESEEEFDSLVRSHILPLNALYMDRRFGRHNESSDVRESYDHRLANQIKHWKLTLNLVGYPAGYTSKDGVTSVIFWR